MYTYATKYIASPPLTADRRQRWPSRTREHRGYGRPKARATLLASQRSIALDDSARAASASVKAAPGFLTTYDATSAAKLPMSTTDAPWKRPYKRPAA